MHVVQRGERLASPTEDFRLFLLDIVPKWYNMVVNGNN